MRTRLLPALTTVAVALSAGLFGAQPAQAGNSPAAYRMAAKFSEAIGRCWFGRGEKVFAGYVHASETNAIAGPPRILIVKKSAPHAPPALVIELRTGASGVEVNVYGPLIESDRAARISADINRWASGGGACA